MAVGDSSGHSDSQVRCLPTAAPWPEQGLLLFGLAGKPRGKVNALLAQSLALDMARPELESQLCSSPTVCLQPVTRPLCALVLPCVCDWQIASAQK